MNLGVRAARVEVRPRGLPLPWLLVSGGCGGAMAAWGWAGPLEPAPSWSWPPGSGGCGCGLRDRSPSRSRSLSIWNCLYSLFTVLMKLNIILILTRLYDTFHQRGRGHEVTVTPLHVSCHVRVTARYRQVRRTAGTPPVELETKIKQRFAKISLSRRREGPY